MKKTSNSLKEILKELSVIPIFFVFLAFVLLMAWLLPDGFVKTLPFEALVAIAVLVILAVLYIVSGIIALIKKYHSKKSQR